LEALKNSGPPVISLAGLLADKGKSLLFANCDGLVAEGTIDKITSESPKDPDRRKRGLVGFADAEDFPLSESTGRTLSEWTAKTTVPDQPDHQKHASLRSDEACGQNSDYTVRWRVIRE
jgi:hypothetical protein